MMAAAQLARRLAYPLHFHVFAGRGRVYEGGFCESGFAYVLSSGCRIPRFRDRALALGALT